MSTPTKRDQRRDTRKAQFQQRQLERRRARERARRIQLAKRYGIIGGGVLVGLLVLTWAGFAIFGGGQPTFNPTPLSPANGQVVDGIACSTGEMLQVHYHANLQIYVDGQQVPVPAGVGIVEPDSSIASPHQSSNGTLSCLYNLHTHDGSGIIHIESPDNRDYTLGNLFDIWGQRLSSAQLMQNKVDGTHKLVVVVFDANGQKSTYTGDPHNLTLNQHDTIYLLYNSPSVQPKPFTDWKGA
jgi:hypothetical protein